MGFETIGYVELEFANHEWSFHGGICMFNKSGDPPMLQAK